MTLVPVIPAEIFKAYDIRGIVGTTLTPAIVEVIGQAIGSEATIRRQTQICLGYDGRLSSPELAAALASGIKKTGMHVLHLGMVTTPMAYFAAHHLQTHCAVMITGSHNPPEYNGIKIMLAGETLSDKAIQGLRQRIPDYQLFEGHGSESHHDIAPDYINKIASDIQLQRPMKIIVDCGNGAGGAYAKKLYEAIGCEVEELFCEVDGHFPHHHPDPSVPENLRDIMHALQAGSAEIGLAFDGDADRLGVVTKNGSIIYPDRQLLLFAAETLAHQPTAIVVYDVKSSRHLAPWIIKHGGQPIIWKTGHSLIKAKMRETGAALGGELSGHIFFNDYRDGKKRWYGFDDGLYAGARLLEIVSRSADPSAILNALPESVSTPEQHIDMKEGEPHALIAMLQKTADFPGAERVITMDGLRVEYADGFGLMRPSNTTPVIVLRFEADNLQVLRRIQTQFKQIILAAAPNVRLPF